MSHKKHRSIDAARAGHPGPWASLGWLGALVLAVAALIVLIHQLRTVGKPTAPERDTAPREPAPEPTPSSVRRDSPPGPAPEGMVWVPGGTFWMGMGDSPGGDSEPVHLVRVDGFWMDRTEVTNRQFAAF